MSRTPTVREAIGEHDRAVYFNAIGHADAMLAIYAGLPTVPFCATQRALADADADDLCVLINEIPNKAGRYLMTQPLRVSRARDVLGDGGNLRTGTGLRRNANVATLAAIVVEGDAMSLAEQANAIDGINAIACRTLVACVAMSGDDRAESRKRARARNVEAGKSLHAWLPHQPSGDVALWQRTTQLAIVLMRGDHKCTERARLMRAPGLRGRNGNVDRLQTVLFAVQPDEVPTLQELHDALCDVAEKSGLDPADPALFGAIRWANETQAALNNAACQLTDGERAIVKAAIDDDVLADYTLPSDEACALAAVALDNAKGNRSQRAPRTARDVLTTPDTAHAVLDRNTLIEAADGRTLPFYRWATNPDLVLLSRKNLSQPLRAFVPTHAGMTRSTGEARREASGALLLSPDGRLCLYCHADAIAYWPSRPTDVALADPVLPTAGQSPYLPALDLSHRVTILAADTGTGKTVAIARAIEAAREARRPVLVVTPRVSVTADAARRCGLMSYLHLQGDITLWGSDGVAVCVNSLLRIKRVLRDDLLLVIEESEQVAQAFASSTMKTKADITLRDDDGKIDTDDPARHARARQVLRRLMQLASQATTVVFADAGAGELTRKLAELLCPDDVPNVVRLARKRDAVPFTMFDQWRSDDTGNAMGKATLLERIESTVRDGKRVMVACTQKSDVYALAERLQTHGKRVLIYTGDSSNADRAQLADVQRNWSRAACDVVICTSVVSAGVSYDPDDDAERFDVVALCAPRVQGIGWFDLEQLLCRVRKPRAVWAYVDQLEYAATDGIPYVPTAGQVKMMMQAKRHRCWSDFARATGIVTRTVEFDAELPELLAAVEQNKRARGATPRDDLMAYYQLRGCDIAHVGKADAADNAADIARAAGEHRNAKRAIKEAWASRVVASEPMSNAEYEAAQQTGVDGDDERARFEHARLLHTFGQADYDLALADQGHAVTGHVDMLNGVALVAAGKHREAARRAREAIAARTLGDGGSDARSATGYRIRLELIRLMLGDQLADALVAPLGFGDADATDATDIVANDPGWTAGAGGDARTFDGDTLRNAWKYRLQGMGRHALRTAARMRMHPKDLQRDPARMLGVALSAMGIARRRTIETSDCPRRYWINVEAWREMCELAAYQACILQGKTRLPKTGLQGIESPNIVDENIKHTPPLPGANNPLPSNVSAPHGSQLRFGVESAPIRMRQDKPSKGGGASRYFPARIAVRVSSDCNLPLVTAQKGRNTRVRA